jgi:hypothetical protein
MWLSMVNEVGSLRLWSFPMVLALLLPPEAFDPQRGEAGLIGVNPIECSPGGL